MGGPDASGSRNRKALHWVKVALGQYASGPSTEKKINSHPEPVLAREGREGKVSVPGGRERVNAYHTQGYYG